MNRRRMMMEGRKKIFLFAEGSGMITNASGEVEKNGCDIDETIGLTYAVASSGDSVFGWISIPANLTGFRRICFDVGSNFAGSVVALGYDDEYSVSLFNPTAPEKAVQYTTESYARKIIKVEIEERKAGIKDVAAALIKSVGGNRYTALQIYNIWLE